MASALKAAEDVLRAIHAQGQELLHQLAGVVGIDMIQSQSVPMLMHDGIAQEEVVDREAAGDRDPLAGQVAEGLVRAVGAHHDDRARAMAERDDLGVDAALHQVHHHRRKQVGRLDLAGHERFLQLGPAAVLGVLRR